MKKIIAFGDSITYPSKDGISAHTIGNLIALSRCSDFSITLINCKRGGEYLDDRLCGFFDIINISPEVYYDFKKIANILDDIGPDVLQTYSSYYARLIVLDYASRREIPVVVEHHDIDTEHMSLYDSLGTSRWQVEAVERASLNRTLSFDDAEKLKRLVPTCAGKIINQPTILGESLIDDVRNNTIKNGNGILFVGNCSYPPNARAVDYIINKLSQTLTELQFYIVGRNSEQISKNNIPKNVHIMGFVGDLSEVTKKCNIGIAPLLSGSGLKLKVLTYLSHGLEVVGTEVAFAGFKAVKYLHQTKIIDFGRELEVVALSINPKNKNKIINYYHNTYDGNNVLGELHEMYRSLCFNELKTEQNLKQAPLDYSYLPMLKEKR